MVLQKSHFVAVIHRQENEMRQIALLALPANWIPRPLRDTPRIVSC